MIKFIISIHIKEKVDRATCDGRISQYILVIPLNQYNCNKKIRLLFLSAEMFKKPLWQTVWTQIRLLLKEQSVLGPRCLLLYLIRQ